MPWYCNYSGRHPNGPQGPSGNFVPANQHPRGGNAGTSPYVQLRREAVPFDPPFPPPNTPTPLPPIDAPVRTRLVTVTDYSSVLGDASPAQLLAGHTLDLLQMILHAAELAYLNDDRDRAAAMLSWIDVVASDPKSVAGARTSTLTPAPVATSGTAIAEVEATRARAQSLILHLVSGRDFFGYPPAFAPLVAFEAYEQKVDDVLVLARGIENSHRRYFDEALTLGDRRAALSSSLDEVIRKAELQEREAEEIALAARELERRIDEMLAELNVLELALRTAKEAFIGAIQSQAQCGFGDVLTVVGAIASIYAGGAGIIAGGAGLLKFGQKTFASTKEEFKYLQDEFNQVRGGVDELRKGYEGIKGVLERDRDAAKLQVDMANFEKTLEPFMHLPEAQEYRRLMRQYVDLSRSRNDAILAVDALARQWASLRAELARRKAEAMRLRDTLAVSQNPLVGEYQAWLKRALSMVKQDLLRALYLEFRALCYWALDELSFSVSDDTVDHLATTHADFKIEILRAMERRNGAPQSFRTPVPIAFRRSELPEQFAAFEETNRFTFVIPHTHPVFDRLAGVLVSHATVRLHGVANTGDFVRLRLFHQGSATFVTPSQRLVRFVHAPRVLFGDSTGADVRTRMELGGLRQRFAYLSPLAPWTIELHRRENDPGLDLSQCDDVSIEFEGFAQAQI